MADYTDDKLEFWASRDEEIYLDQCPCCGLNSKTLLCEHCDFDIGKWNDGIDIEDARKFVFSLNLD